MKRSSYKRPSGQALYKNMSEQVQDQAPSTPEIQVPKVKRPRSKGNDAPAPNKKPKNDKFRLSAKSLFLTYPRTGGNREELLKHLQTVLQVWEIENYIVAKEHHKDDDVGAPDLKDVGSEHLAYTNEHFHAYIDLKKKCNIVNPNLLDWNGHHGNYVSTRCRYAAIEYCTKEDKEYLVNPELDIPREVAKGKRAGAIKGFSKGAMNDLFLKGEVTDEWLMKAFEEKILNPAKYKQIHEFRAFFQTRLNEMPKETRVTTFTFDCSRPWVDPTISDVYTCYIDFTLPEEERRKRPSVFWLWGVNCTGKSYLAEHQKDQEGKIIPSYAPCMSTEDWSSYKGEQIIIFNEFRGAKSPRDLINYTEGCQVNQKYGKSITLPRDLIVIITTNTRPEHVFRNFIADDANTSSWKAFCQRCQFIELTGRNPAMPEAHLPRISGPREESQIWHDMCLQERELYTERLEKERDAILRAQEEARLLKVMESVGERMVGEAIYQMCQEVAAEANEEREEDPLDQY